MSAGSHTTFWESAEDRQRRDTARAAQRQLLTSNARFNHPAVPRIIVSVTTHLFCRVGGALS